MSKQLLFHYHYYLSHAAMSLDQILLILLFPIFVNLQSLLWLTHLFQMYNYSFLVQDILLQLDDVHGN